MIHVSFCLLILIQPTPAEPTPAHIREYLKSCEAAKAMLIELWEIDVEALRRQTNPTTKMQKSLETARENLKKLRDSPAPLAPLRLPPSTGDVGIFVPSSPADPRKGKSVDVLEVVDEDDVIVRLWYVPKPVRPSNPTTAEDITFVDVWLHGVETDGLKPGMPAVFTQVFHREGSQTFRTDCGGRSLPLLVPVDVAPYRKER